MGDQHLSPSDGAVDAALSDAGAQDAAPLDALSDDAALPDAALPDAALPDAALPDAALPDAALPDAALPDAALPDAALDAARPDAAPMPDASPDAAPCVPSGQPEACDGQDNDCDGQIDEQHADVELQSATGIVAQGTTLDRPARPTQCAEAPSPAVSWRWTAPSAGIWRFDTGGSSFDTVLQIQADACVAMPDCSQDRAPQDVRAALTLELEEGQSLVLTLAGQRASDAGDYLLRVDAGPGAPSYIVEAALTVLRARHADDEGSTWGLSFDSIFPVDWALQLPERGTWGLASGVIEDVPTVAPDAAPDTFHPDLMLPICAVDADCLVGRCRPVAATVEQVGQAPQRLCMGPSDYIWDEMYQALARAERVADVSSLDFPDNAAGVGPIQRGRFLIALRNALRYLHDTGAPVEVRFFFGWLVNDFDFDDQLEARVQALTDGVPADTALRLYFGSMNYDFLSWNHSKIIATDGQALMQGGINFYSTDYLGAAPVQDISMKLFGGPARDAHRYMDTIWRAFDDDYGGLLGDLDGTSTALVTLPGDLDPPGDLPLPEVPPPAMNAQGVTVLSLGRLGLIDRAGVHEPSPSDEAMLAAIAAARESLVFSLQDLGSVRDGLIVDLPIVGEVDLSYGWPEQLMRILADRALDGVTVKIIISEFGAGAYSYGWSKRDALQAWQAIIEASPGLSDRVIEAEGSIVEFLCNRIDFASVRIDAEADRWADDSAMGNHSKFWIVDDRAIYIGSQNLYLSNLFEWGLLVDDAALARQVKAEYWTPLWAASSRSAISGPSADGRCALRDPPPE